MYGCTYIRTSTTVVMKGMDVASLKHDLIDIFTSLGIVPTSMLHWCLCLGILDMSSDYRGLLGIVSMLVIERYQNSVRLQGLTHVHIGI